MYVSGFSFIKNAIKFDYQFEEAIRSILPLCDEVVVAVGDCSDGTRELVLSLGNKVRIVDTVWDTSIKQNGRVLAVETDKALQAINPKADWCIYIQGDEVLHEDGLQPIREAMEKHKNDEQVDGLLLNYKHFFGSYDWLAIEGQWYRHEIRVIKNNKNIYSYRDAQGFRKNNDEKLNVKKVDAWIYHYGWVHNPAIIKHKNDEKAKIYHDVDAPEPKQNVNTEAFVLGLIRALAPFKGTHPAVMKDRIARTNWTFDYDVKTNKFKLKDRFKNIVEKITGNRPFEYKNYKVV